MGQRGLGVKKLLATILLIGCLLFPVNVLSLDRCNEYRQDERIQHTKYFGLGFPYWYGVAQLQQESCCRAGVTAFDAGMGISQFMPKTAQYINSLMGENLNPYNPEEAIKMQAFYMYRIHKNENFIKTKNLWADYQIYNGGGGNLKKEYIRAGKIPDWDLMKAKCTRGKVLLKNGTYLYFCDVNYSYSLQVYKYGKIYKIGSDGNWYFW